MQSEPGRNLPVLVGPRLEVGVRAETTAHQPRDGPGKRPPTLQGGPLRARLRILALIRREESSLRATRGGGGGHLGAPHPERQEPSTVVVVGGG